MGSSDTIEVIDGLDSDSTTGFNIFGWCNREYKIPNQRRTYDRSNHKLGSSACVRVNRNLLRNMVEDAEEKEHGTGGRRTVPAPRGNLAKLQGVQSERLLPQLRQGSGKPHV